MSESTKPNTARIIRDLSFALLALAVLIQVLRVHPDQGRFESVSGGIAIDTATGQICSANTVRPGQHPLCTDL